MRLNCAIFDMDGTVIDSMEAWMDAVIHVLTSRGIAPPADVRTIVRPMNAPQVAVYLRENFLPDLTQQQLADEVGGYMENFYTTQARPKPGAKEFLSLLKMQGVQCYLATATQRELAEKALLHTGLAPYFKGIITSDEVGRNKADSPAIYQWAMKRLGGNLADTVVFEDALFAIRTAKKAGFRVAGVYDADSEGDQEEIRALSDHYITSFEELYRSERCE